jgi:hypothetical protein
VGSSRPAAGALVPCPGATTNVESLCSRCIGLRPDRPPARQPATFKAAEYIVVSKSHTA